ncbi:MAG: RNHCP domain-containing protein [Patescibacteria group bacterium]
MKIDRKFQRTVEDFKCTHCGAEIKGNGYTNHCENCLWSKHVDKNPGDRSSNCNGEMPPLSVFQRKGNYFLVHKCTKCGLEKNNKVSGKDDFEKVLHLSSGIEKKK